MIKKRYIIVALGVVSILFGSLLVNNVLLAQSGGEYDPWLDYNEDGTIDVNDLSPLGEAYGSSGDSTKNVSVTNWPEPQKPTFPETLVLRGLAYDLWRAWAPSPPGVEYEVAQILIDENTPYPPTDLIRNDTRLYFSLTVPTSWERGSDQNFTFVPANAQYFIQGDVPVRTTISHACESMILDELYYNITVHLEKVGPDTTTVLASDTISILRLVNGVESATLSSLGVILHFPSPVLVESGERLQIRFETWVRSTLGWVDDASIYICHELGTDEFIAQISILQP